VKNLNEWNYLIEGGNFFMLLRLKLRTGSSLIFIGGLLATLGEILNLWNADPSTGGWLFTTGMFVLGVLLLVYGINLYAQASDTVNLVGLLGSGLFFLAGLVTIVGTVAVDMIAVPVLLGLAATVGATVNGAGSAAQTATNGVGSGLNAAKNGIAGLFGQSGGPDVPTVNIPNVNGMDIVNKGLAGLHLPSFAGISQWGHFFFTGGVLAIGGLLLGLALLRAKSFPSLTCQILIVVAVLNLLSQIPSPLPFIIANITGILLCAALTWVGASFLFPKRVNELSQQVSSLTNAKRTRVLE
jgi:hypothetical protein